MEGGRKRFSSALEKSGGVRGCLFPFSCHHFPFASSALSALSSSAICVHVRISISVSVDRSVALPEPMFVLSSLPLSLSLPFRHYERKEVTNPLPFMCGGETPSVCFAGGTKSFFLLLPLFFLPSLLPFCTLSILLSMPFAAAFSVANLWGRILVHT